MQHYSFLLRPALAIVALVGVALGGSAARADEPATCVGVITGGTFSALVVPDNETCTIFGFGTVTVGGNVAVGSNAELSLGPGGGLNVTGSLVAEQAGTLDLSSSLVSIGKGIDIGFSTGNVDLFGASVSGNVSIHDANVPIGEVFVGSSSIGGQLAITNNTLNSLFVLDNVIDKHLMCFGNTASGTFSVSNNTVGGKVQGQCE